MKFLTFTGSPVKNEKFHICVIDYVQNSLLKDYLSQLLLLTCISIADWCVFLTVLLFTFVVIFFSHSLGYFPYVMFNKLALLLLSMLLFQGYT